jgi:hypothetical protein
LFQFYIFCTEWLQHLCTFGTDLTIHNNNNTFDQKAFETSKNHWESVWVNPNPSNTIFEAKQLIGMKFSDELVENDMKECRFQVVCVEGDWPEMEMERGGECKRF